MLLVEKKDTRELSKKAEEFELQLETHLNEAKELRKCYNQH